MQALRLGQPLPECNLSDSVIVLAWEGLQIGIVVNAVHEVNLIIEGGDTKADKRILEEMKDPLMHILRNAIGSWN